VSFVIWLLPTLSGEGHFWSGRITFADVELQNVRRSVAWQRLGYPMAENFR
jgi:hypothetical protein